MSTADIVAMKGCQFQKDRDERARCAGEMCTADIEAMKVRQFHKDRDEQAWCVFKRVLSMNARIVIVGVVGCFFSHLPGVTVRRGYLLFSVKLLNMPSYYIYNLWFQRSSRDANFAPNPEATDGEAANPGPRMRRRGPRSAASKSERRAASNRRAQEQETPAESSFDWNDAKFWILHVNIRGWISHAAVSGENTSDAGPTRFDLRERDVPRPNSRAHYSRRIYVDCTPG